MFGPNGVVGCPFGHGSVAGCEEVGNGQLTRADDVRHAVQAVRVPTSVGTMTGVFEPDSVVAFLFDRARQRRIGAFRACLGIFGAHSIYFATPFSLAGRVVCVKTM